jgi:hypothetical protein
MEHQLLLVDTGREILELVSPATITDNFSLGSTDPLTSQFSVTGIAANQAVASLSGNLVVMPNASNGFGGNVGIGTTNPLSLLSVGSGSGFQVNSSGAITAATGIVSSGTINFSTLNASSGIYTDSSKNLTSTVPTSGVLGYWTRNGTTLYNSNLGDNVGIGTNSPTAALDVNGSASIGGALTFRTGSGSTIQSSSNQLLTLGGNTTGDILFKPGNSSSSLYLSAGGNVGIGTTNPLSLLSVGSGSGFQVNSSGAITAATGIVSSGTINFSTLNASSGIYTDSSKNLTSTVPTSGVLGYWTRNGTTLYNSNLGDNVGIGTNSPTAALDVNGSASIGGALTFRTGSGSTIQSSSNQLLTLGGNTTGDISIGTT